MQTLTARLGHQRLDIKLALLVRAGQDPDAIHSSTAIHLSHKVKAVNILIKIRAVPVGHAILMPGDRRTNAGLLDKQRLIKRRKVRAIDGLGDFE